jgi:ribosomal protein L37AE/L43A
MATKQLSFRCPECNSKLVYFRKTKNDFRCQKCDCTGSREDFAENNEV